MLLQSVLRIRWNIIYTFYRKFCGKQINVLLLTIYCRSIIDKFLIAKNMTKRIDLTEIQFRWYNSMDKLKVKKVHDRDFITCYIHKVRFDSVCSNGPRPYMTLYNRIRWQYEAAFDATSWPVRTTSIFQLIERTIVSYHLLLSMYDYLHLRAL